MVVDLAAVDGRVELTIEDDGTGFDAGTVPSGHGLANIRARAEQMGGTVDISTRSDGGTTVFVRVPVAGYRPASTLPSGASGQVATTDLDES